MSGPASTDLRLEEPEDAAAVREIHRLAFGRQAEADIVDAVRIAKGAVLSMVAADLDTGGLTGHVLYTRVCVRVQNDEDTSLLGLAPVAVLPSHQGQGIGTMLIEASLERLRADGHPGVVVVGDPHYYSRFGFLPGSRWGLHWEGDASDKAFMVAELSVGALAGTQGQVRFRPEFGGA
jgi:putative acetyltransferase